MIIIVNPGTHPEPIHLAVGLVKAGREVVYVTSSSLAPNSLLARMSKLRVVRDLKVSRLIRRRVLPAELTKDRVAAFGRVAEIRFQLLRKYDRASHVDAMHKRNVRFQRSFSRWIKAYPSPSAVVLQQTAAKDILLTLSNDIVSILNYPIAHHRWLDTAMRAEAVRNPEWAAYLQGHDRPPTELDDLDTEIRRADHILLASSFVESTFIEAGIDASKLHVIPLGAYFETSTAADTTRYRSNDQVLNLLFAGQLTQRKGISYLLDAIADLPFVELTMVGHPVAGITDKLRSIPRVRVLGSKPQSELRLEYQRADLLVLPSLAEGFALVALEAMAEGTPCILSEKTFADDVITHGHDGYVVEAGDTEQLKALLLQVHSDPVELAMVGARARRTASSFTWDAYEKLAARRVGEIVDARADND